MTNNDNLQKQPSVNGGSRLRRIGILAAGLGMGSLIAYLLSRLLTGNATPYAAHVVDDRGTDQRKAASILRQLRDRAFEASDEKLALALGRPVEEVAGWSTGRELIDDDVVMKARGIAMHRGVRVE